jgi:DNA-binding transcriptional ArsR family regulator
VRATHAASRAVATKITLALYNVRVIYLFVQVHSALDATLAALSDPTRRAILAQLAEGEATINELAQPFAISQPAISRHIKVLTEAGLIVQRVEGTKRPCRLAPGALSELDEYLEMLRKALEQNYHRLDRLLAKQRRKDGKS